MRKSIFLLLTLLMTSTSYSKNKTECFKVIGAYSTSEGYLEVKNVETEKLDIISDRLYVKAVLKYLGNPIEFHSSAVDGKVLIMCLKDTEILRDGTIKTTDHKPDIFFQAL